MELLSAFRHGNQDCGPHASDQNLSEFWRGRRVFIEISTTRYSTDLFSAFESTAYCPIKFGTSFAMQIAGLLFSEHSIMPQRQSGFTLIEIAIVLVIIGLLLGGILKGQELINSARVKNLATDFRNIPLFIYGYQDKFRTLPGDDPSANAHVGTTAINPGSGNGNGVIDGLWNSTTAANETILFWQHVRLAGLAPGVTTIPNPLPGDFMPTNASGGIVGIQSGTADPVTAPIVGADGNAISGAYIICSTGILGKFVKQLDIQMDDSDTAAGSMMATPTTGYNQGAAATATTAIDDATSYTVCMGV